MTRKDSRTALSCSSLCPSLALPAELVPLSKPSGLLPGENLVDFEIVRQMMIDDIQPQTNIEWLWTLDIVALSWDILRYQRLRSKVLDTHRSPAIEAILRRLDSEGMPSQAMAMVELQARRTAAEWRDDPKVAREIEERLRQCGFDDTAINAEVFIQMRESFEMFDQLIQRAQNQRIALLRELGIRRERAERVRRTAATREVR